MSAARSITRLAAMPGTSKLVCLIALPAALVALAGCGSSNDIGGKIPASDAAGLTAALNAVDNAVLPEQCGTATAATRSFIDQVNQLPDTAGTDLKTALRDAGGNLEQIVGQQCASGATGPSGAQTDTSSSTSTPPPTTASTTTTSTTSTTSQPSEGDGTGTGKPGEGPPPTSNAGGNGNGNDQGGGNPGSGNGSGGTGGGVSG
jgi:hypothetical protein